MFSNQRQPLQVELRKDSKIGDSFEPTLCSQFHLTDPDQRGRALSHLLHFPFTFEWVIVPPSQLMPANQVTEGGTLCLASSWRGGWPIGTPYWIAVP